jgi:Clp amino terminal domain, pathogenicity island component
VAPGRSEYVGAVQTTHKISADQAAGYAGYLTSTSKRGDYYTGAAAGRLPRPGLRRSHARARRRTYTSRFPHRPAAHDRPFACAPRSNEPPSSTAGYAGAPGSRPGRCAQADEHDNGVEECATIAGMFERFTERARQVVVLAQEEARSLRHNYIGTEHILLGLLREEEGLAAGVLESLDITAERVRAQVVRIVGSSEEPLPQQIPFTPRGKKVLELALREALSLGHNDIGTEHILLGLVRENDGVAARILLDFDADSEKIRNEVIRMLSGPGGRRQGSSGGGEASPHRGPHATIGEGIDLSIHVGPSPQLHPLLLAAASRALSVGRIEIEPRDLLHALASGPDVATLLTELGIDATALREALERDDAGE